MPVYLRLKQDYINFFMQATFVLLLKLALKFDAILSKTYKDMTLYRTCTKTCIAICFRKTSVYRNVLYIRVCSSRNIEIVFCMFGAILKVTKSSFLKDMTFCRKIYMKKVMKLLAFIFEQPSYNQDSWFNHIKLYRNHHWSKIDKLVVSLSLFVHLYDDIIYIVRICRSVHIRTNLFFCEWLFCLKITIKYLNNYCN